MDIKKQKVKRLKQYYTINKDKLNEQVGIGKVYVPLTK